MINDAFAIITLTSIRCANMFLPSAFVHRMQVEL